MREPAETAAVQAHASKATGQGYWTVWIHGLEEQTAVRLAKDVPGCARRLASDLLGIPEHTVHLSLSYTIPDAARDQLEAARREEQQADELRTSAKVRTKRVIRDLHRSGFTIEDIAEVLGLKGYRVGQLLNS